MKLQQLLLVDDQPEIIELMTDYLEASGYTIFTASNATEASQWIAQERIDLILLDIMMPGEDGFSFCKRVRERHTMPILFLSAKESDADKIRGLTIGADDYIVKSASPAEIVARVKAIGRRMSSIDDIERSVIPGVKVDERAMEIKMEGHLLDLTFIEYKLFMYFYEHLAQVLTYEQILNRVWGHDLYDYQNIRVYVARLREKLSPYSHIVQLHNIRSVGYKLSEATNDAK
ncbi:response regulator transcription factor [Paenibacillus daejeonensis]|uniref:response regulator transcription factor n=1 Tax=Paenibacillus daejeonensis TaxID=135193 RepID=UPI000370DBB7|nr:response regulator transcription factor [Paenibacillus daejeonensis]